MENNEIMDVEFNDTEIEEGESKLPMILGGAGLMALGAGIYAGGKKAFKFVKGKVLEKKAEHDEKKVEKGYVEIEDESSEK